MADALYVPGKANFKQPEHGKTGTSAKKNPGKLGFKQNPAIGKAGKSKSGMMNVKGKVGFDQPNHGKGATSSKKNPGKVGFAQPNRAGKSVATGVSVPDVCVGPKAGKVKTGKVSSPAGGFKNLEQVQNYRRKKYGV